jgi:hypothetical protein
VKKGRKIVTEWKQSILADSYWTSIDYFRIVFDRSFDSCVLFHVVFSIQQNKPYMQHLKTALGYIGMEEDFDGFFGMCVCCMLLLTYADIRLTYTGYCRSL